MNKESIDEVLKETDGIILYNEQLLQLLCNAGFSLKEINIIRKAYAKRLINKVVEIERQMENSLGKEVADYLISKIRCDYSSMCWKIHENAYYMCYGL